MIVSIEGNTYIITQEKLQLVEFIYKLKTDYGKFENSNIIVNLFSLKELDNNDLLEFLQLSNAHRENKHSFVIVTTNRSINEIDEKLIVVPTLQEAKDIIEMEEIERDLGF
ncbi:MAG: ribonuclease Z [Flavobacteriaceae bacterium]|nr:ribonuclease Z [Flavobacteriaceae bacterium]